MKNANHENLQSSLIELIRKTSTDLPLDIQKAIQKAKKNEEEGTSSKWALDIIEDNIKLAVKNNAPLCQDTGTIFFFVDHPAGFCQKDFVQTAKEAVVKATEKGYLRQNSVDSLNGKNSGNNLGPGHPSIHFHEHDEKHLSIKMMLKGGGCENVGIQYAMPYAPLSAGRDIQGVKKVILDAVFKAQGKGCAPGVLGVCIGGDRGSGYLESKHQFLRKLDDKNENPLLNELEEEIMGKANKLDIGPMGFGGKTTLLGCKIGMLNRLPASYYVSISYMCWAYRRHGVELNDEQTIKSWLY